MTGASRTWLQVQQFFQKVALVAVVGFSVVVLGATLAAALGLAPWLSFTASYGETVVPYAGMITQLFLAALAISLCFYLPSNRRILELEKSHRNFHISMEDIARAYAIAHKADREELFSMSSEFDAVRERIMFMREHPELETLEPSVLEVAAQMGREARELAEIYSDEKVGRAKTFLKQRQEEIEQYRERLNLAQQTVKDLKRWSQQVHVEDSVVQAQMNRLEADLAEILPLLGYEMMAEGAPEPENVVALQPAQAKVQDGPVPLPKPLPKKDMAAE
ncbi:DNA repair protein [uncultured Litoreibacter sp.]|uniref:DNA repair protein n=1 Tax=uncultured Litoreibacter sp. TaxID=1392394 RepID=UPI00262ECAED|nr:DNA repair protein [uncultured Litoreibacter sp.]